MLFRSVSQSRYEIGTNEIERWKVVDSNPQSVNIGGDYNYQSMNIKCDKGTPAKKETDSAPTGKSLEERVKSLENAVLDNLHDAVQTGINTRLIDVMYETQPKANKWFQDEIAKVKQEMESRTEQLSDEHNELKNAFEAECDKYDAESETAVMVNAVVGSTYTPLTGHIHSSVAPIAELKPIFDQTL